MSKAPWKRLYGLPHRRWRDTDALDSAGRPKLTDCDTFGTSNVVREVGYTNVTYGKRELEACGSFHHHVITFDDGSQEWASHSTSCHCIGEPMHAEANKRRLANLVRGHPPIETVVVPNSSPSGGPTDPSSGTSIRTSGQKNTPIST